jgi:hypothetical protein
MRLRSPRNRTSNPNGADVNTKKFAMQAGLAITGATLGLGTIIAPAANAAPASNTTPQAWSCRELTVSTTGARVSASICWESGTAKVAGQIYDTKGDSRSACAQIKHNGETQYNYCDHNGHGTSTHFVTGEFRYSVPVTIAACTENWTSYARCSDFG